MGSKKKIVLVANLVLLCWFFLDMIGMSFGTSILVTRSYQDDGIFFVIFVIVIMWFWKSERTGKYVLSVWLILWFFTQFFSHWYFSIFGPWYGKNKYFSGTLKLVPSKEVYIPDLYHIILHLLILVSFILTVRYLIYKKRH